MNDESQIVVPRSFIEVFVPAGKVKPTETRDVIASRYELCEDLAQMLVERAQAIRFELGVTEADVLQRVGQGLLDAGLQGGEPAWVLRRLAELLDWPWQADASEA